MALDTTGSSTHECSVAASSPESIIRSYRFALDPTPLQCDALRSHCGAQRFAYNWGLRVVRANLEQRAAEQTYGLSEDELTPYINWSAYGLRKHWNSVKDGAAPWWRENSKEAYASGLANLATALLNWQRSKSLNGSGRRVRFPVFKRRTNALTCRFSTGAFGLTGADRRHVRIPRVGIVRTHESTRKLARRVGTGSARIRSVTVSFSRGRWFVSFSVEMHTSAVVGGHARPAVGVDLGLTNLAVVSSPVPAVSDSDGVVANPQRLEAGQAKLRRLERQAARRRGPDRAKRIPPSKRWLKSKLKTERTHARIANARSDTLHKLTTAVVRTAGTIVIEDLNIAGMIRNRSLARRIAGASWGEMRRQFTYKAAWSGVELIVADRFYASTKICSACGAVKAKLPLSERTYRCEHCGLVLNRDVNASRNLVALAAGISGVTSSPSCGATLNEPAGNSGKTDPVGNGYRHGKSQTDNVA